MTQHIFEEAALDIEYWKADINGGAAIAKDQNAKASEALNIVTTAVTNITLTPNGTNFVSGEVRLDVLYGTVKDLEDYPVEEGGE